jgi:hypothetical protein
MLNRLTAVLNWLGKVHMESIILDLKQLHSVIPILPFVILSASEESHA